MAAMTGGDKLMEALNRIDQRLTSAGSNPSVRVGFLEGSTYPDGTSVPMVASVQEFGGTINKPPGKVTVFRKLNASGSGFLRNGRFVKRAESNFSTTHDTPAHSITIPPRPFFRNMIKRYGKTWGADIAKLLRDSEFDAKATLSKMGERMVGQLRQSIVDTNSPPLAPSTIRRKGFSKPLVDTGVMLNSADYEVST